MHHPLPFFLLLATLAPTLAAAPARAQPADTLVPFASVSGGLAFAENRGQWPDEVLFRARLGGGAAWVTPDGVLFDFYEAARPERDADARPDEAPAAVRRGHVVAMRFEGGRARRATGHGRRATYHNYFLGSDPARWAARIPLYDEVVLEGLYDGIDLRLYADGRHLRYDLVVAPGADVSQVRVRMEGAENVSVTSGGSLRVGTAMGPVEHRGLLAYQEGAGGGREAVASAFRVGLDGSVGFDVAGADPARRLVIDPLLWATFLGGNGGDYAYSVDVGEDGSATVAGATNDGSFPTTPGAYSTTFQGIVDAFVARLSPAGDSLEYATLLGGTGWDEIRAVALGPAGEVTVTGRTSSADFPATPDAFDDALGGTLDAFVARLSPAGDSLEYATFLGGTGIDDASGMALHADGSTAVVGRTLSADFPTTLGAYDPTFNGYVDAFAARLTPDGDALVYATFLGGSDDDSASSVAVGTDGAATIAGITWSAGFPTTPDAFAPSYNGGKDAFVARLAPDGGALVYATFLGGTRGEIASSVAVGTDGSAIVGGRTFSEDFPTTPGAYDLTFTGPEDISDAFVTQLSADGSALVYSTFLGSTGGEYVRGVALGANGSAVAVGATGSAGFPTTPHAYDPSYNGGAEDAFLVQLSPDGSALAYATFLGGAASETAWGVAVGPVVSATGSATVVGMTESADFPVTPGAFGSSYNGGGSYGGDAFIARFDFGPNAPGCPLSFNAADIGPLDALPGDTLTISVEVANEGAEPRPARLTLQYARDGGLPGTLTLGQGTVPVTSGVTDLVDQRVPGSAPAGRYSLHLGLVDVQSGATCDTRPFTLTVLAPRVASAAADVPFEGAAVDGLFAEGTALSALAVIAPGEVAVWPNPASGKAAVAFGLDAPADVRVTLYDVLGREVAAVDAGRLAAGPHRLSLDLSSLAAGVYVWRLVASGRTEAGRLTVAR